MPASKLDLLTAAGALAGADRRVVVQGPVATDNDSVDGNIKWTTLTAELAFFTAQFIAVTHIFTAVQKISVATAGVALTLESTEAGSGAGPYLVQYRNSASPLAGDDLGGLYVHGNDSALNETVYGIWRVTIADPTNGSEDAYWEGTTYVAGVSGSRVRIGGGIYHASVTGGDKGDNTLNFGTIYQSNQQVYSAGGTDVAVADGGTGSSTAAGAATNLGLGTGNSPQFTAVNVGDAADSTLSRASAGDLQVETNRLFRVGGVDVPVADGGTGASTALTARSNLGFGNAAFYSSTVTVGDDAVLTIPITDGVAGMLFVTANGGQHLIAQFYEATPAINAISAAANTNASTAALSGTTGTDGKMTVSVNNNSIQVENRLGGAQIITVFAVASG